MTKKKWDRICHALASMLISKLHVQRFAYHQTTGTCSISLALLLKSPNFFFENINAAPS